MVEAPLGGLEIRQIGVEGSVLIPEIRLSINLNAATIDKVIARRRKLLREKGDVELSVSELGLDESGLSRVIRAGYKLLGLQTFFTAGPKETRACRCSVQVRCCLWAPALCYEVVGVNGA